MPPAYVKPYVKRGKTDAADAEAIAEAVTRPTMRFVAIKTEEQQAALMLHKAWDLLVRQRTMLINSLRKRRTRRKAIGTRAPILVEAKPNARWSLDFVHDQLDNGRRFRVSTSSTM